MREWFENNGAVEWFLEQFDENLNEVSAAAMFRWVLLSWAAAAIVFIVLDRFGAALLGRSRPLAQVPPTRARAWRWGRRTPPQTYSLLPPGTTVTPPLPLFSESVVAVERPAALPAASETVDPLTELPDPSLALDDPAFWRLFSDGEAPLFGLENSARLVDGEAPERYNPITGRVEALSRDHERNTLAWQWERTLAAAQVGHALEEEE